MISHKHSCIFIHVPKSAGTSIETALGHLDKHMGRGGQDHRSIRMLERPFITARAFSSLDNIHSVLRRLKHQYYNRVANPRNKIVVSREQYESYYKFTFVRNPWARVFSWYNAVMRDEITKRQFGIVGQPSLKEALGQCLGRRHLRPQLYWIKDFSGSIPLDFIGRFENLAEDYQEVCRRLSIDNTILPHKVKGAKQDYREHYDENSKNIVMDFYRDEIEMFGYTFEE